MHQIRIAQWGQLHLLYLPLYVAERTGLFAAQGLDANIYFAGNDDAVFAEVARGRADFGVGDPGFVAMGQKLGHKTRVVAALINNICNWGITQHAEIKPIVSEMDLVGLRIGCYPKPSTTYTLLSGLKARHPKLLKTMHIVEAEIGHQAYLLASGQADLVLELEPMVSIALRQGLRLVCSMADFYGEFLFTGLMTSLKLIEEKPQIVERAVRALQHGLIVCRNEPAKAIAVAQGLFPTLGQGILGEAIGRMIQSQAWPEQTIILPKAWQASLKLRRQVGELKKIPPFESVIDNRFAYAALTT